MRVCESVLLGGDFQRLFERGELAAQRGDLLIEHFDLRQGAGDEPLLDVELGIELGDLALRIGGAGADPS